MVFTSFHTFKAVSSTRTLMYIYIDAEAVYQAVQTLSADDSLLPKSSSSLHSMFGITNCSDHFLSALHELIQV